MPMGGGPPGNGPQGPPGAPGVPLPLAGPLPHGVHPQNMPPAAPGHMAHHAMMPGQGPPPHAASPGYGHAPPPGAPGPAASPSGSAPQAGAPPHPPSAQTPPHGQAPPTTSSANGAPPASSPMQGSLPTPGPDNLHAIQRTIDSMEEKGLQEDPRFSQLLALRARSNPQDPGKGLFSNNQLCQLK